jgi:LytS/YehU family sensor histidine kinase
MIRDNPGSPPSFSGAVPVREHWTQIQMIIALAFLVILGIAGAYFLIKEWVRREFMRKNAESLQLTTELKFLRSQVNPHFLFNTLNNLFAMALKDGKGKLADSIAKLSGMMRYMLYETDTEAVSLDEEVECMGDYIALHLMRYAVDEVTIDFTLPTTQKLSQIQVAPMLFVPFLENAFKHGISIGNPSYISLSIKAEAQTLYFFCENIDYSAVKKIEDANSGIGLENVKRRLELIYPNRHTLQQGTENGKYFVNLKIDLV